MVFEMKLYNPKIIQHSKLRIEHFYNYSKFKNLKLPKGKAQNQIGLINIIHHQPFCL